MDRMFSVVLNAPVGQALEQLGESNPTWLVVERTGKTLLPDDIIGLCDIRNGDIVRMVAPGDGDAMADRRLGASIEILTGPRSGETLTMDVGELSIGRAADNGFVIIDPGVSRFHGSLELKAGGEVIVHDHGSTNGVIVEDARITGSQPVEPGDRILVGQTWFVVRVAPVNELGMSTTDDSVLGALNAVVVPPSIASPPSEDPPSVEFPTPPEPAKGGLFRSRKSPDDEQLLAFRADLEEIRSSIEMLQDIEVANRRIEVPDVDDLAAGLEESPPVIWRTPVGSGLKARLGLASLVSRVRFELPDGGDPALREEMAAVAENYRRVDNAPVVVDFAEHRLARVHGAPDEAHGLVRSLVAQLALRHRPSDVRLVSAVTGVRSDGWRWMRWLPHCGPLAGNSSSDAGVAPTVASDPESARQLLAGLASSRAGRTVVILDGHAAGDEGVRPHLMSLLADNPLVSLMVVADDGATPAEAVAGTVPTVSIEITDQFGTLVTAGVEVSPSVDDGGSTDEDDGSAVMGIACESMSIVDAEELARSLAPMVEPVVPNVADQAVGGASADAGHVDQPANGAATAESSAVKEPVGAMPTLSNSVELGDSGDAPEKPEPVESAATRRSEETNRHSEPVPVDDDVVLVGSLTGDVEQPDSTVAIPQPVSEAEVAKPVTEAATVTNPSIETDDALAGPDTARSDVSRSDASRSDVSRSDVQGSQQDGSPSRSGFFGGESGEGRGSTASVPPPRPANGRRSAEQSVIARTWERSEATAGASLALGVDPSAGQETVGFDIEEEHLLLVEGVSDAYLAQLVAGLAVTQSPFKANFVLLDALGGRMLASCDRLPHTVASVINPTPAATKSALAALAAELDRREALVATLGCDSMADLRRAKPNSSVPHLVVIVSDPAGTVLGGNHERTADAAGRIVTVEPARELAELARRGSNLGLCMIVGRAVRPAEPLGAEQDPFASVSPTIVRFDGDSASVSRPGSASLAFSPSPPRMAALTPDSLDRLVSVLADVFRSSGRPEPVSLSL